MQSTIHNMMQFLPAICVLSEFFIFQQESSAEHRARGAMNFSP